MHCEQKIKHKYYCLLNRFKPTCIITGECYEDSVNKDVVFIVQYGNDTLRLIPSVKCLDVTLNSVCLTFRRYV